MHSNHVASIPAMTPVSAESRQCPMYYDFQDFAALAAQPQLLHGLVSSYQAIFGDPDGWAEHYSVEDVLAKLTKELSGHAALRVCADAAGDVIGFCWAQALNVDDIVDAISSIDYYQSIGAPEVDHRLRQLFANGRVIYLHDLGIARAYRGRIPLSQLIYPVLDNVAEHSALNTVFFWSIAETNVSRLAKRAQFHPVLTVDAMCFYAGDLHASRTRPEIMARV